MEDCSRNRGEGVTVGQDGGAQRNLECYLTFDKKKSRRCFVTKSNSPQLVSEQGRLPTPQSWDQGQRELPSIRPSLSPLRSHGSGHPGTWRGNCWFTLYTVAETLLNFTKRLCAFCFSFLQNLNRRPERRRFETLSMPSSEIGSGAPQSFSKTVSIPKSKVSWKLSTRKKPGGLKKLEEFSFHNVSFPWHCYKLESLLGGKHYDGVTDCVKF